MTISVERIEILGLNVSDVDAAQELLTRLFGITFLGATYGGERRVADVPLPSGSLKQDRWQPLSVPTKIAIDTAGLFELIESHRDESEDHVRNIHFKVPDIDAAIAEMQAAGIGIVANIKTGRLREVVFDEADLYGMRLCLVQYDGPSLIAAMLDDDEAELRAL